MLNQYMKKKKNEGRKRKEGREGGRRGREGGGEEREGKEVSSKSFKIWEEKRRELFTGLLKPTTTPLVSSGTSGPGDEVRFFKAISTS